MTRELVIGQEVAINNGSYWSTRRLYTFATVTKITKTQVTLSNGNRYLLRTGEELGTGTEWHSGPTIVKNYITGEYMTIEEAKQENIEIEKEQKRIDLGNKLAKINWKTLSLEVLTEIEEIVNRYQSSKEE